MLNIRTAAIWNQYYSIAFATHASRLRVLLHGQKVELSEKYGLTLYESLACFSKLIKDKYIEMVQNGAPHITVEGLLFEGYEKQKERIKNQDEQLTRVVERQLSQTESVVSLTRWLALGTIGLLAFEILKFYLEHRHCA